ncbi:hypothetical protein [Antrihabitans cavernicola]|uniref:Uncharacterized protein n=1 Tax=Antrihabitans cavernicola TaxID=2495913 RepID=A0A5A7SDT2_9NOCA|nr:hypothetical protein [Spelaeibacter cavernicola]KAA0022753.1 hypothetical protein FOY51_13850 [Spelaeibacter cavernicola]
MNAVIELSRLAHRRPGADATVESRAAWYRAKGRLLELLGDDAGPDACAHAAVAYARAALIVEPQADNAFGLM